MKLQIYEIIKILFKVYILLKTYVITIILLVYLPNDKLNSDLFSFVILLLRPNCVFENYKRGIKLILLLY